MLVKESGNWVRAGIGRDEPECAAEESRTDTHDCAFAAAHRAAPLSVLVITSNKFFAERLQSALQGSAELALLICGAPRVKTSLDQLIAKHVAQVVVVDSDLIESGLVSPQRGSGHHEVEPELLLVFDEVAESAVHLSLLSHAHGCLQFDIAPNAFVHAVDTVANGSELWFPRWMMEPFYDMALTAAAHRASLRADGLTIDTADSDLTEREVEVMQLVRRGMTNKEIGSNLGISPNTVKKHLHNALVKHGILRRRQLFK